MLAAGSISGRQWYKKVLIEFLNGSPKRVSLWEPARLIDGIPTRSISRKTYPFSFFLFLSRPLSPFREISTQPQGVPGTRFDAKTPDLISNWLEAGEWGMFQWSSNPETRDTRFLPGTAALLAAPARRNGRSITTLLADNTRAMKSLI